ncbi:SRPBCC family protein [Gordonia sp. C13]|uniref:SRPBCC family protein n=1 Tax=Gordonia sp. C13 TaxID=2935078 RepID=UPI00200AE23A|nr:SRPBCC family protein [Gordonia sp. C13]MCK8615243.1 SRPBCC family protein [Gordonia sp. C13]
MRSGPIIAGLLAAVASSAAYYAWVRPWVMTWGATDEEVAATLPGDELLPDADGVATRAITIDAPPEAIYPWLAQMGPFPRGGAYTYDWIENLLGIDMHSTDRVLEEFQHPTVGETIGVGPEASRIEIADPDRAFVTRTADGDWVWSFTLVPDGDSTRLISRNRFRLTGLGKKLAMIPMEPGSLIMERKMLHGIKERAEALAYAR